MNNNTLILVVVALVGFLAYKKIMATLVAGKAKKILDSGEKLVIVDVRSAGEYSGSHIKGSIHIPLESVQTRIAKMAPKKDAAVMVYCQSGSRSAAAAVTLRRMGYTQVLNLGGIGNWKHGVEGAQ